MSENQGIAAGVTLGLIPFTGGASLLFAPGALQLASAIDAGEAQRAAIKAESKQVQSDLINSAKQVRQEAQLANEMDFLMRQRSGVEASMGSALETAVQNAVFREQQAIDLEERARWEKEIADARASNARLAARTAGATQFIGTTLQFGAQLGSLFMGIGGAGGAASVASGAGGALGSFTGALNTLSAPASQTSGGERLPVRRRE